MAIKTIGPELPQAPGPQEKGKAPGIKPEKGSPQGAGGNVRSADGISISSAARALSSLDDAEEVRPGAMDAARRLLDEKGDVVDTEALRVGVARLLRMLED